MQQAVPCARDVWHIQVGSHLGVFPLMAVASGCSGIAVEGNANHTHYMHITSALNSFQGAMHVINAVAGDEDRQGVAFGEYSVESAAPDAVADLSMVTLDSLDRDYVRDGKYLVVVIDVEGFEQEVLRGAKKLINSRRVPFFQIELWWELGGVKRTVFPGLRHLESVGYTFFFASQKQAYTVLDIEGWQGMKLADFVAVRNDMVEVYMQKVAGGR
jgi:FkbM family methyltransferase